MTSIIDNPKAIAEDMKRIAEAEKVERPPCHPIDGTWGEVLESAYSFRRVRRCSICNQEHEVKTEGP